MSALLKAYTFFICTIIALFCTSCSEEIAHSPLPELGFDDTFVSDIIGVSEKHLSPEHWIKPGMDKTIMNPDEIQAFNIMSITNDPTLYDLGDLPDTLSKDALIARIRSISNIPKYKRIYTDGTMLGEAEFANYEELINLEAITETNLVRFALAIKRTDIRTYPTNDLLFSHDANNRDIERFQESALFPGDPVAVLHESTDGKWALIQSYNYIAWAPLNALAIGNFDEIRNYVHSEKFLVITGDKVSTVYNPEVPEVSELQLDMGIKVPLSRPKELANNLYGQNPYLSHMVLLPVRNANGGLAFRHALVQRKEDVHVGYLPYTEANIIRQAFKFLGERYGWGHRYNGRDCTGFVSEIYKSFGIQLPRNSGDQGKGIFGDNLRFDKTVSKNTKVTALKNAKVGDLIYIPGHVMMYLGVSDGQPFVIHDVAGLGYLKQDGGFYKGTLNGVSITPIIPLHTSKEHSYLDTVYNIKTIR